MRQALQKRSSLWARLAVLGDALLGRVWAYVCACALVCVAGGSVISPFYAVHQMIVFHVANDDGSTLT